MFDELAIANFAVDLGIAVTLISVRQRAYRGARIPCRLQSTKLFYASAPGDACNRLARDLADGAEIAGYVIAPRGARTPP